MKASIALASDAETRTSDARHSVYRRVSGRLLPFLFTCYLFNYIDRLNVGFAHSGLARDLHFSDAVFGVGVGMFFVGYLIFELPSTLLLERFGARKTITRIAELRSEKARLLGYYTWAAYTLDDQMAKTPERAIKLLTDMAPAAVAKAKGEARGMEALAKKDGIRFEPWDLKYYSPGAKKEGGALQPWDWQFYSEQVKKKEYELDGNEIKQYFPVQHVIDSVF